MSADENAGDSEAGSGSFMVPDGYLSQEEGVSLEDDENTPPDIEMLGGYFYVTKTATDQGNTARMYYRLHLTSGLSASTATMFTVMM